MEQVITSTESPGQATEVPPTEKADSVEPAEHAEPTPATGSTVAGPTHRPAWRDRVRHRLWQPLTLLVLVALLPPLVMALRIRQSTELNYQDYWSSMLRFTNPNGSLHLRGLFTYQNEHPFVVPQAVYYLDARFLHGTNHELGIFSLLMAAAALAILWLLLPRTWSPVNRGLLLVAASATIFCPSGVWNFVRGMSGTAWLTANVFALAAVLLASRRRTVPAVIVSAFALITYGTGFGVPVAVIVVALLRRDRRWRWLLPLGLLLGALAVYAKTSHGGTSGGHGHDPGLLSQAFLTNLATLWDPSGGSLGVLLGAAGLVVLVACGIRYWAARDALADLVPWWGVLTYSLAASALISLGRSVSFAGDGAQSRYVSLSALFWISFAVIVIRTAAGQREITVRALAVLAAVLVFWGVSPVLYGPSIGLSAEQDEVAAGLRFNATDPFDALVENPPAQIPRLQGLHAYPFVSSYTVGCGYKPFQTIDMSKVRTFPSGSFPRFGGIDADTVIGGTRQVRGWIFRQYHPTLCAVLVDPSGKIVGGGSAKIPRSDVAAIATNYPPNAGYELVTPASNTDAQVLIGFADGFWKLPDTLKPPADDGTSTGSGSGPSSGSGSSSGGSGTSGQ